MLDNVLSSGVAWLYSIACVLACQWIVGVTILEAAVICLFCWHVGSLGRDIKQHMRASEKLSKSQISEES